MISKKELKDEAINYAKDEIKGEIKDAAEEQIVGFLP